MTTGVIPIVIYYQAGLLFSITVCLGVAVKAIQMRRRAGALWLGLFMLAAAWWSLALLVEFTVTTIPAKIFWAKMEYLGSMSILIFLLFFALEFNNAQQLLKFPYWLLYFIMPVVILVLTWTNDWHHLIWASFTPVDIPGSNSLLFGHGTLFGLVVGYAYLTLLIVALLLFRSVLAYRHVHRRQAVLLTMAILTPWLGNVIYVLNLGPIPGMDFTPFGFALTGALLGLGIARWRFLELTPIIARERLIEEMQQGVIVLDDAQRIIDINLAARQILNLTLAIIGQSLPDQIPQFTIVLTETDSLHEIEWPGPPARTLSVSGLTLLNWRKQLAGYLIMCRDITEANQIQQELWQRQLAMAVMEERQQFSDDLHAKTGQVLDHLVALAHHASRLLEKEQHAAAAAVLAQQVEIARGGGANIDEFIRRLPSTIAPPPDFFEALTQYAHHFSQTRNVAISLTHPPEPADKLLSPLAQIQLLRIIQVTLLDMAQAGAGLSAQVIISAGEEEVQIVITQPGYQADEQAMASLFQSRAESVGGWVEIRAGSDQTGYIIIYLPRRKPAHNKAITTTRILLVDDQEILRESFEELLTSQGLQVVGSAGSGPEAIELARRLRPDVILMDIRMPGMSGLEATRRIKTESPYVKVIILTSSQSQQDLIESLRSGASGYLLKTLNPARFFDLLVGVINGDTPLAPEMVGQVMTDIAQTGDTTPGVALLSSHQLDVLRLVAQGLTYREVAERLHLSQRTVQYHIAQIKDKLNVASRAEAVGEAIRGGWWE